MLISDKIHAVEEFLDWREEHDPTGNILRCLEEWAAALRTAKRAEFFAQIHSLALAAEAGAEDPANLARYILEHVDG